MLCLCHQLSPPSKAILFKQHSHQSRAWQAETRCSFFFYHQLRLYYPVGRLCGQEEASWSTGRQQASCSKTIKSSWEVTYNLVTANSKQNSASKRDC